MLSDPSSDGEGPLFLASQYDEESEKWEMEPMFLFQSVLFLFLEKHA